MPASSTIIADPLSTPKVPKLRSSCEGCGSAKVKCDRGQPKCSRCFAFSLACVYGISRKFGKPPRKRLGAHFGVSGSSPHGKRTTRSAERCENHMAMVLEQSQAVNNPAELSFSDTVTHIISLPSDHNAAESTENCNGRTAMGVRMSQSANKAAQLNFSNLGTDVLPVPSSINTTSNIYEQNRLGSPLVTPFSFDELSQFDIWASGLEFPSFTNGSGLESRLSASALEPVNNLSTNFDSPESHSCPRGSYELFRDLICPSPFLHATRSKFRYGLGTTGRGAPFQQGSNRPS